MSVFTGAAVAIVTPFKENGDVDYDQFYENIEYQIAHKTDAIVVCGTTGESSTMSHEEHLNVIEACVKRVNKRVPVIAGTGSNSTAEAIHLSTEAEKRGADALLLVSPYYNKATQKGLFLHFKAIADSVNIPIILYNIPGRTGVNIQPQTIVKLCTEVKNIVGVKEATGDLSQTARLSYLAKGKVDIYCGDDNQTLPFLSVGAKGVISVLSNIAPEDVHDMCEKFFAGKVDEAREMQIKAIPLIDALFSEVNPIPVKKAMNYMGWCNDVYRSPLCTMDETKAEALKEEMEAYGLL
ncbi:MAG: 4-hydroxy-tetrahydrodipicolinate synthase [Lachnospiraceae bacterium]|nr:4-hydroxy-tetrahydrodipicolinate synthase [Lachnospiraceae bacterium]MBP5565742.1 4-hydroxy-tetrahydrodipicolinate synthase [Lachnospiraceae bacterium]